MLPLSKTWPDLGLLRAYLQVPRPVSVIHWLGQAMGAETVLPILDQIRNGGRGSPNHSLSLCVPLWRPSAEAEKRVEFGAASPGGSSGSQKGASFHPRLFEAADYPRIAEAHNLVYPDDPVTPSETQFRDEHRDPQCRFQRWVVEDGGRVVAFAEYDQFPEMYHPQKFILNLIVPPDLQRRGIGKTLYDRVLSSLQGFDPLSVRTNVREDMTGALEFLTKRGFQEDMRNWESHLEVSTFDFSPFMDLDEKLLNHDIEIKTIEDLKADPDRDRRLYQLQVELDKDVPLPEEATPISFDYFNERTLKRPSLLPEAYFVALHKGAYVGTSYLFRQSDDSVFIRMTGVKKEYRRLKIALALKLRTIDYAQRHGYRTMSTWNESTNEPIVSLNERLGFVKQPSWIGLVKDFPR